MAVAAPGAAALTDGGERRAGSQLMDGSVASLAGSAAGKGG